MTPATVQDDKEKRIASLVTPKQLFEFLLAMIHANQPVMIWGQPGVGKSDVCKQVAAYLKYFYHTIHPLLYERIDMVGIPYVSEQITTEYATPGFFPPTSSKDMHLINIEEITSSKQDTQSALFQLIWDRRCGDYELPEGARLVACGNRLSDRGVVHRMPSPLASRFIHVELGHSIEDWTDWAIENDIDIDVISFLNLVPDLLNQFKPKSDEVVYPCPRTWQSVSRTKSTAEERLDEEGQLAAYIGAVGHAAASDFWGFLQAKHELPQPRTVIMNPEETIVPHEPSQQILLSGALIKLADDMNLESICTYAHRMEPEISHYMVGQIIRRNPEMESTDAYSRWIFKSNKS